MHAFRTMHARLISSCTALLALFAGLFILISPGAAAHTSRPAPSVISGDTAPHVTVVIAHPPGRAPPLRYTVHKGDFLYGIAAAHCRNAADWSGIYTASKKVIGANPDLILPGETLILSCRQVPVKLAAPARSSSKVSSASHSSRAPQQPARVTHYTGSTTMQQCIIAAESGGNPYVWNATGHWGLYQFSYSTWVKYGGSPSLFGSAGPAYQTQIFWNAVAANGYNDWAPYDGCL